MKQKKKIKGFTWDGFIKPIDFITPSEVTVYRGNFVMEIVLPNRLIVNMQKLKNAYDKYMKSHMGRVPSAIRVNRRQYEEYKAIFPQSIWMSKDRPNTLTFNGIPLLLHMSLFKGFDTLPNDK